MLQRFTGRPATRPAKIRATRLTPTRLAATPFAALAMAAAMLAFAANVGATESQPAKPQPQAERPSGAAQPAPGELAREGLAKMLQALDVLVQSVPQYHMPEITENGDIILRRKQPQPMPAPPPQRRSPPAEKGPGTPI